MERGPFSSSSIISMARIFGAPVMEPPGKAARRALMELTSGASVPLTVETMWCSPGSVSILSNSETVTLPGRQTRPRSFRSRSTIITCSARSFTSSLNSFMMAASSSGLAPLGRVPFIGIVSMVFPETLKNLSGELETRRKEPRSMYEEKGAGEFFNNERYSSRGSPGYGTSSLWERFIW